MSLEQMIDLGYISKTKHQSLDLYIFNYTKSAQYERVWNSHTINCRGLIKEGSGHIVARPFPKFFNWEELSELSISIPNEPYEVFKKVDGSLGIVVKYNGELVCSTRGSFSSDQANYMRAWLYENNKAHLIKDGFTYLFEIIYPDNRIVVNYGDESKLVLLAVYENDSGKELSYDSLKSIGFELVEKVPAKSFHELKSLDVKNEEGYVIRFKNGFRMKIKFENYIKLHRVVSGLTTRLIWEYLSEGKIDELLSSIPEEFLPWAKEKSNDLTKKFLNIEFVCRGLTSYIKEFHGNGSQKDIALYVLENVNKKYTSIVFNMLKGKNYSPMIWKMIYPDVEKCLRMDEE
jgi:RNA ligase